MPAAPRAGLRRHDTYGAAAGLRLMKLSGLTRKVAIDVFACGVAPSSRDSMDAPCAKVR